MDRGNLNVSVKLKSFLYSLQVQGNFLVEMIVLLRHCKANIYSVLSIVTF